MTTPTLAQFAKAFCAVRRKYPDAPGLPAGHSLIHIYDDEWWMSAPQLGGEMLRGDSPAALALCVTTAMEVGAWWENQDIRHREMNLYKREDGWFHTQMSNELPHGPFDSLPSAALAMLEVIGGG